MLTGRGQLDAGVTPLEQYSAESILHRLDARAHSGLGDVQVFGGAIEITAVGNFQKGANMINFHVGSRQIAYRVIRSY